jgi:hypothetical protein
MNKIETAIYEIRLQIRDKENKLLIAETELKSLKQQLDFLLIIEKDKSIPHEFFNK